MAMIIDEVARRLAKEYGADPSQPHRDPVSELILTILSQHTSDTNSRRAFQRLRDTFADWRRVMEADTEEIARCIWVGGLARVKAPRIKEILWSIKAKLGSFDLSFLGELPLAEAKAWLRRLPGVGPKTVGCVLLFSLGRPALPVDTHVYRVAKRLGLIEPKVSMERAHDLLEAALRPGDVYQFHVNMVKHGRRICQAQRPRCSLCVLAEGCPSSYLEAEQKALASQRQSPSLR